jgi:nitroreductase
MDTFDTIRTALAVRQYQEKPIPPQVVRRIVEAAWQTGSSMNRQPWHFIVVQKKETLQKLGELAATGPYIAQAAMAVVVAVTPSGSALSDASRAIQSMIIAAWAEGVGSNWVGSPGMDRVKSLMGIPESLDIVAIVPFGYPAQPAGKGKKKRKPLGEVAHQERFGQPFE